VGEGAAGEGAPCNAFFTLGRHARRMANINARQLRAHQTDAESTLWRLLRDRRFAGCKFRRQHPIGPFIADFACVELRLVIEADEAQHVESVYDERRTAWLEARSWRVVRFWNNDVRQNPGNVVEVILAEIVHSHPPLTRVAALRDLSRKRVR
jgi:very-short-patch-repair endonuclease